MANSLAARRRSAEPYPPGDRELPAHHPMRTGWTGRAARSSANRKLARLERLLAETEGLLCDWLATHGALCGCPYCSREHPGHFDPVSAASDLRGMLWAVEMERGMLINYVMPPARRRGKRKGGKAGG